MKYNQMPGAGFRVSAFCLGTMTFGGQADEAESLRIMDYAVDHGVNFFDTANVYTGGESERIVGLGLAGRRDKIILATKGYGPVGEGVNNVGLSRHQLITQLEGSLRRLGIDYVDIYYLHNPDRSTPLEETLETMDTLVRSGKVRYVGVSNYAAWEIGEICALCDKRNYVPPVITENLYNMLCRSIELELTGFLARHPMALTAYNPIAAGLLTGKHRGQSPIPGTRFDGSARYMDRYWNKPMLDAVEAVRDIAEKADVSMLELSLKWCAQQPFVTSVISGASRFDHVVQNLSVFENGRDLDAGTLSACDAVWKQMIGPVVPYYNG